MMRFRISWSVLYHFSSPASTLHTFFSVRLFHFVGGLTSSVLVLAIWSVHIYKPQWFSHLSQNTRELHDCEPRECEEDELLAILVTLKLVCNSVSTHFVCPLSTECDTSVTRKSFVSFSYNILFYLTLLWFCSFPSLFRKKAYLH